MREEFYVDTKQGMVIVSADTVNEISGYLVAHTETREDLDELLISKAAEQDARRRALQKAYFEIPVPMGSLSLEVRCEIQERRNELVEKYYQEFLNK